MTMTVAGMEWLEARGLDVEVCSNLGLDSHCGGGGEAICIPTFHHGEIVRRKYRPLERKPDAPKFWMDKGGQNLPYNVDCLYRDDLIDKPLLITEGEFDAIAAIQSGYERTISVPNGSPGKPTADPESAKADAWINALSEQLSMKRVRDIIICSDGDEAGHALLQDLSVKLGKSRCRYLTYPKARNPETLDRPTLKDLNEVLMVYGVKGVQATVQRAEFFHRDGVYRMGELPPVAEMPVYETGMEALNNHFKLRLGDLSVWTGVPSSGKSTFLNHIIALICKRYGVRAAFASFEQDRRDHRRALRSWFWEEWEFRLTWEQKQKADAWVDESFRFMVPGEDEDPTLEWLLEKMEIAVIQHDCKILVVDPWNSGVHEMDKGETETDYVNRSLRTIVRFAAAFGVHVAIVAHPTKMRRNDDGSWPIPSLYDCAGSAAWFNKPAQGVVIHRPNELDVLVKIAKSRYHEILGEPGIVKMHYNRQTRRFVEVERNVSEDEGRVRKFPLTGRSH